MQVSTLCHPNVERERERERKRKKTKTPNSAFSGPRRAARTVQFWPKGKKSEIVTTKKCKFGDSSPRFAVQSPHMTISWDQDRTSGPHQPFVDDIEQQIRHTQPPKTARYRNFALRDYGSEWTKSMWFLTILLFFPLKSKMHVVAYLPAGISSTRSKEP
jgi:hypothetical protein